MCSSSGRRNGGIELAGTDEVVLELLDVVVVDAGPVVCMLQPRAGGVKCAGLVIGRGIVVVGVFDGREVVVELSLDVVVVTLPASVVVVVELGDWFVVVGAKEKWAGFERAAPDATRQPSNAMRDTRRGQRRSSRAVRVRAAREFITSKLVLAHCVYGGGTGNEKSPGARAPGLFLVN